MMQVFEKIGWIRKAKGWSQEDIAERLGMSPTGYGKIERGETDIPLSRLEQISAILDINLSDLIGLEDRGIFNIASSQTHFNNHIHSSLEPADLAHDLSKAQLEIEYLKEMLAQKDKEIACLRELLDMLKNPPARENE
ncbi:MAG: XRE family transcriptional regulator [Verrucomicrobia bacterium]|nr:MAG: XRE family transcriptional regulator [Verrucomicrobiota bacterium]